MAKRDDVQCYYCGRWFSKYEVDSPNALILICVDCKEAQYDKF